MSSDVERLDGNEGGKRVDARGGFNPMTSSAGDDLDLYSIPFTILRSGLPRYFVPPPPSRISHRSPPRPYPLSLSLSLCHVHDLVKFCPFHAFSKIFSSLSLIIVDDGTYERTKHDSVNGISTKAEILLRVQKSYRNVTNDFNKRNSNNDDTTITATTP